MTDQSAEGARGCAVKVLYSVIYEGSYSNLRLKDELFASGMTRIDRALCTNIVYGVLQNIIIIDYYISHFSKIKIKKISPWIMTILRCGIYQLVFLDKVPNSAVCDESVKLAKKYGHSASAGFVNAILRNAARSLNSLPEPSKADMIEYLSITTSVPRWIVELWRDGYGIEICEGLCRSAGAQRAHTIIVNTIKTNKCELVKALTAQGVTVSESAVFEDVLIIDYTGDISELETYKNGLFTSVGIPSIVAAKVLCAQKGDTVIDVCAAPGGKSLVLASSMHNEGKIYSFDLYTHKVDIIRKNAQRFAATIIDAEPHDARTPDVRFIDTADRVLCDVPCSGLGIIAKKPDIRLKTKEQIKDLPKLQLEILMASSQYLKAGGELVYSTCTLNPAENEQVIDAFLADNAEFYKVDILEILPEQFKKSYNNMAMNFFPQIYDTDGFFICKLRRKSIL